VFIMLFGKDRAGACQLYSLAPREHCVGLNSNKPAAAGLLDESLSCTKIHRVQALVATSNFEAGAQLAKLGPIFEEKLGKSAARTAYVAVCGMRKEVVCQKMMCKKRNNVMCLTVCTRKGGTGTVAGALGLLQSVVSDAGDNDDSYTKATEADKMASGVLYNENECSPDLCAMDKDGNMGTNEEPSLGALLCRDSMLVE